jgi:hypothetical protein
MSQITVTVDESHRAALGEVAAQLREKGMRVDNELDAIGVITGEANEGALPGLRTVAGVESVRENQTFQAAPPDSAVQ